MEQEANFKIIILSNNILLGLIIIRGGRVQISSTINHVNNNFTDLGGFFYYYFQWSIFLFLISFIFSRHCLIDYSLL